MCQGGQNQNTTVMPSTTFVTGAASLADLLRFLIHQACVVNRGNSSEVDGIIQDVQL